MDISTGLRKIRRSIASFSILALVASLSVVSAVSAFSDVKEADWFFGSVQDLVDAGIVDGSKDKFNPGSGLQRDQAAKMVVLAAGIEDADMVTPATPSFKDLPKSSWAYKYVETAKSLGFVKGDDGKGTFRPADSVNRAEFAKMLTLALELEKNTDGAPHFSDVKSGAWYYDSVETAYHWSVVKGYDGGVFKPEVKIVRSEAAKMLVGAMNPEEVGATTPTTPTTPNTTPTTPTTPAETKPAGGLTIAASDSPIVGGTIADGTAFNSLLKVKFTAGTDADVKVTKLKISRGGLIADTTIKLSAYDAAGKRHGGVIQVSSDHTAEIGMESDPIVVAKGTSVDVTIKANVSASANSSTLQLSVGVAGDVTSSAVDTKGSFPIMGGSFNVVDGASSVAAATFDVRNESSTVRNVDIGQKGYEVTKFELIETSSKEDLSLKSLKLFNNGSTSDGDLTNITLKDQSGNVLATVPKSTDKYVTFALAKAFPIGLGTTKLFTVEADVVGGATRTAQLIVQNDFDIEIAGVSTGASILATAKTGGTDTSFPIGDLTTGNAGFNQISVNEGSLSVAKDNSSPSGDVTKGANDVVLGTFKLQALGEDIELQRAAIDLAGGGDRTGTDNTTGNMECPAANTTPGTTCDLTGSVKLVTEDGKTLLTQTAATTALWNNVPAYSDLSSYYTIKAGDSKVIKIIGNLSSGAGLGSGESITAGIRSLYYYKKSSLKYADSTTNGVTGTTVSANALTATTSSLTVSSNTAYGSQTMVNGTSNSKIASFVVKAGSAEGVSITTISLKVDESDVSSGNANITNLKLMKVKADATEVQLGTTQNSVTDNTATSFSVSGFSLAANEQAIVNVYADIGTLGSTNTLTTTISASGVSGNATMSATSTTAPAAALALQVITGATGGQLVVSTATDTPLANQWVAGSTGNDALKIKFAAALAEDIYIKEVTVRNDSDGDDIALSQATLVNVSATPEVNLGTVSWQQDGTNPGYATWTFSGSNRPKVPSNGVLYLTVRADVVSSQQAAVSGLTPRLSVASVKSEGVGQISPLFSTSTPNLSSAPASAATTGTTITPNNANTSCTATVANGSATTITLGSCATNKLAVGMLLHIAAEGSNVVEDVIITTVTSGSSIEATRGANSTVAGAHSAAEVDYGPLSSSSANNVAVIQANGDSTFDTEFAVGQVIRVENEDMYVMSLTSNGLSGAYETVGLARGVNGTTVAAHAANKAVTAWTSITANEALVVRTKPTFTAAADSPSGAQSAGSQLLLAKFNVAADLNAADSAENSVILNKLDVKFSRTGVNLANLNLYPAAVDQNATYAVAPSFWVSANTVRFNIGANTSLVNAGYNKIIEGSGGVKGFTIRGDITATGQGGTLTIQLGNIGSGTGTALGTAAATAGSLGAGDNAGDAEWLDAPSGTTFDWVKQGTTTQIAFNAAALSYGSASGTLDTTRPVVSTVVMANRTGGTANTFEGGCTSAILTALDKCDNLTITFSEAIDPTTINANLVPGTNAVGTTAATSPVLGVLTGATGGLAVTSDGGGGADNMSVTNILGAYQFGTNVAAASGAVTTNLSLDAATQTILQVFINAVGSLTTGTAASIGASTPVGTVLKDLNGNFLNTTNVTPTGSM